MRLQRRWTPRCRSRRAALAAALQDVAAQLLVLLQCPVLGSLLLCPTSLLDLLEGLQPFIAQARRVLRAQRKRIPAQRVCFQGVGYLLYLVALLAALLLVLSLLLSVVLSQGSARLFVLLWVRHCVGTVPITATR